MDFHNFIEGLRPSDCNHEYCFLRFYVESSQNDPTHHRILMQLKCIEKFKWFLGEELDHDLDWEDAMIKWVERGYAKRFGALYNPELSVDELWDQCMEFISSESSL